MLDKGEIMEKFVIGLAVGGVLGAVLATNNYKMRTIVKKSQEEVQAKLDELMDEKIREMDEKVNETAETVKEKAKKAKDELKKTAKKAVQNWFTVPKIWGLYLFTVALVQSSIFFFELCIFRAQTLVFRL